MGDSRERIKNLFSGDLVDQATALDGYQKVINGLAHDPSLQRYFDKSLDAIWIRKMVFLEKEAGERREEKMLVERENVELKQDKEAMERESERLKEGEEEALLEWRRMGKREESRMREIQSLESELREVNLRAERLFSENQQLKMLLYGGVTK